MSKRVKQDISIGGNLRDLRMDVGLSQGQAADKLRKMGLTISREMLSQMERGVYNVRVSILLAMKELYNVTSFDDFFAGLTLDDLPQEEE